MGSGLDQLEIDEESRKLFVLITPFELYRYKRLVMGTHPASSKCHDRIKRMLEGLSGLAQVQDYLIVHGQWSMTRD